MNYDENMLCPVCKAKLFTDEVAVCPDCGAPHHKECFLGLGHCFYADKHGTDEQWTMPKIPYPQEKREQHSSVEKCRVCGYPMGENDSVCKKCGAAKGYNSASNNAGQQYRGSGENPFFAANGINKDENIDGERAEDIAKFVGYNALRYINVFRKMSYKKTKTSWNWLAFLLPEYWLVARKCYIPAILMGFYSVLMTMFSNIALSNPVMQSFIQTMRDGNIAAYSSNMPDELVNITVILGVLSFVSIIVKVLFGIFGDYIYKKKVYADIKTMRETGNTNEVDFIKNGGVNLMLPLIMYFAMNILVYVLLIVL